MKLLDGFYNQKKDKEVINISNKTYKAICELEKSIEEMISLIIGEVFTFDEAQEDFMKALDQVEDLMWGGHDFYLEIEKGIRSLEDSMREFLKKGLSLYSDPVLAPTEFRRVTEDKLNEVEEERMKIRFNQVRWKNGI